MTDTLHPRLRGAVPWSAPHSNQSEQDTEFAPRQDIPYRCLEGHTFQVSFAADNEVKIPGVWECRRHGVQSKRADVDEPDRPVKPARTHWVMLQERRSLGELEELLNERLDYLARCRKAHVRPDPAPRGTAVGRTY